MNFQEEGFTRVERDDRLFDVFPQETREKGVELWERWDETTVILVKILIDRPLHAKHRVQRYSLDRSRLEQALLEHESFERLDDFVE